MSQYLLNRIGSCRLFPQAQSAFAQPARSFINRAAKKPIPPAMPGLTPASFLAALGRSMDTKVKVDSWDELWRLDRHALKAAGLAVRDRRYVLWSMEKYRQGLDPHEFAHAPPPKKKIRGHGPAVQDGKRIRSRRQ